MFHPRARARNRRVVAGVVVLSASLVVGCAVTRSGGVDRSASSSEFARSSLSPAQERRAQALAEYATGVSEEFRGNLDAALGWYQHALQLDPQGARLAIRVAQIYLSKHDPTNAVSAIETAVKANPHDAELLSWLGLMYRSQNQNDKAAAALRQALRIEPTNVNALGSLLDLYAQQDSATKGIKLLDRAFHQKAGGSDYWMRLGDFHALICKQKPTWAPKIDRK